jgi:hypothetical protein
MLTIVTGRRVDPVVDERQVKPVVEVIWSELLDRVFGCQRIGLAKAGAGTSRVHGQERCRFLGGTRRVHWVTVEKLVILATDEIL